MSVAIAQNTLRKFGADLRWLLDKAGVKAETAARVIVVVETAEDRKKMIDVFDREYDPSVMDRSVGQPTVIVHGVRVAVTVREPK
jgi:hypothetical protein